jgi:hypothetical protein
VGIALSLTMVAPNLTRFALNWVEFVLLHPIQNLVRVDLNLVGIALSLTMVAPNLTGVALNWVQFVLLHPILRMAEGALKVAESSLNLVNLVLRSVR